jgi:hypothetical protein
MVIHMEICILLLQLDWTIFKGVIALFGIENFIKKFLCRALPWFWMVITKVFSIMMKKVCACGGGVGGHLQVIIMSPKQSLGDILCLLRFLLLLLFFLSFFFLLPKVYPIHFSATTERKSMKLHRNVKHYE